MNEKIGKGIFCIVVMLFSLPINVISFENSAIKAVYPLGRPRVWFTGGGWVTAYGMCPIIPTGASAQYQVKIENEGDADASDITIEAEILYAEGCTVNPPSQTLNYLGYNSPNNVATKTFNVIVPINIDRKGFRIISLVAKYYKYNPSPQEYPGPYYVYSGNWLNNHFFAGGSEWNESEAIYAESASVIDGRIASYSCTVTLTDAVRKASLCVVAPLDYKLYVNGILVNETPVGIDGRSYIFPINITNHLHAGVNTINISQTVGERNGIIVNGGALLNNGEFVRILSNESWYYFDYSDNTWKKVRWEDHWGGFCYQEGIVYFFTGHENPGLYRIPPYFDPIIGPIIGGSPDREPIFDIAGGAEFEIRIPKVTVGQRALDYELNNSFTGATETPTVVVTEDVSDKIYEFTFNPSDPGVWNLYLCLERDNTLEDERCIEIAVVGEIEQPEVDGNYFTEGMNLQLIKDIDCTVDPDPYRMDGGMPSTVVGNYRYTGSNAWDIYNWFSYAFEVDDLTKPYLVEVTYPDNAKRAIGVRISEIISNPFFNGTSNMWWPTASYARAASGTWVGGDEYPNSNQPQRIYTIYFPNSYLATVDIVNLHECDLLNRPAAASRIRIYKITNDLPAVEINNDAGRFLGVYSERESLTRINFYQGEAAKGCFMEAGREDFAGEWCWHDHYGFYQEWYNTTTNLIKYMRFCGINLYMPSLDSYSRAYYPSNYSIPDKLGRFVTKDHIDLMAKMFEKNGLSLILGLQFTGTKGIWDMDTSDDAWGVGRDLYDYPTIRIITKDGDQIRAGNTDGGFNYFKPEVKDEFFRVVEDIVERYKDYPAIKGIYFHDAGSDAPGLSLFDIRGYSGEIGWTQRSYTIGPGTYKIEWGYIKDWSEFAGDDKAWIDDIQFNALPQEGFESPSWPSSSPSWHWESDGWQRTPDAHSGSWSICSGSTGDNQYSSVKATITGPGTLTFWFNVSSQYGHDYLRFRINGSWPTYYSALDSGYDDWTWNKFADDEGLLPADRYNNYGRARFMYRYNWAMSNLGLWINWRCATTAEQVENLRQEIDSVAPSWKTFLSWWWWGLAPQEFNEWTVGSISYDDALKRLGFDLSLSVYKDPNVVIMRSWEETPERTFEGPNCDMLMNGVDILSSNFQGIADPDNFGQGFRNLAEFDYAQAVSDNWVWDQALRAFWRRVPPDKYFAREYFRSLIAAVPSLIYYYQSDCDILTGGEQGMRKFARAYRTLKTGFPNHWTIGDLLIAGSGLVIGNDYYFFIANNQSEYLRFTWGWGNAVTVTDLATNEVWPNTNSITVILEPYELRSFKVTPPPSFPWSPTVEVVQIPKTDVNIDGKVNILDIAIVARAFGSVPWHPRWNPLADIDNNDIINILDIAKVARDFG